jgi:plasmid stabilization system protein ParE
MKRYRVVIEEPAQADVQRSYDWGCRVWGKAQAQKWIRDLRAAITKQLTTIPTVLPLAPENDEFREEIRQMIVGRYRVLFTIQGRRVHVLHVRGAYIGRVEANVGEE